MTIYLEEEFLQYTKSIRHDFISRLNAVLAYTSLEEISPASLKGGLSNFDDLKQQMFSHGFKTKYVNTCMYALRKYLKFIQSYSESRNVWVMALGADAFNLDKDFSDGTISIGWEELGDLKQYSSKEEVEAELVKLWPQGSSSRVNNRLACYEFAHRMQVGDLVFIRHGRKDIVAYGYVAGDYRFDAYRKLHNHVRPFNWVARGRWELEDGMHHSKTLTEIGRDYPETVIRFKQLVGLDEDTIIYPDTLPPHQTYEEGSKLTVLVNAYERNPEARQKCIDYHKAICRVCEFDFEKVFGKIGLGFIHVHHLKELRDIGESYHVNPITDLAPVCPNCHAMLHKRRPAYSVEELKSIMAERRG